MKFKKNLRKKVIFFRNLVENLVKTQKEVKENPKKN